MPASIRMPMSTPKDILTYAFRGTGKYVLITCVILSVGAYTLMTNARILGVIYREREDELAWV